MALLAQIGNLVAIGETTSARHRFAIALITFSSVSLSFGGLLIRSIEQADAWQINFYRSITVILVLGALLFAQHGSRTVRAVSRVGRFGLLAACFLGVAPVGYVLSMQHTTVANTVFVISALPVTTALLAWITLGERIRTGTWVAIGFALAGIAVMVGDGISTGFAFGNMAAIFTTAAFTCFAVIVRARRHIDMSPVVPISGVVTAIVCFFVTADNLAISGQDLMLCLLWGILSGLAGNWLFVLCSRHLAAGEVTLLMLIEFVLAPIWVWLLLDEVASIYTLIGGALVLSAVAGRAAVDLLQPHAEYST